MKLPLHTQTEFPWAFSDADNVPVGECFGTSDNNARAIVSAAQIVQSVNRIAQLAAAIREHNEGCLAACGENEPDIATSRGCRSYLPRGRRCPECPQDWVIEMPSASERGEK